MCAKTSAAIKISTVLAACALTFGMAGFYSIPAAAEQPALLQQLGTGAARIDPADLERAFWICDYTATTHGLDAAPVDVCTAVTDELKNGRFDGDFLKLLAWWQQNKPIEHRKLEHAMEEPRPDEPVTDRGSSTEAAFRLPGV